MKLKSTLSCLLFTLGLFSLKAQDFAKGADVGWLSQMEASGIKFYNNSGVQQDLFQILKDKGINSTRLRVWVNPANGYSNVTDVTNLAVRAKNAGMRIMIDFHYSDSWADPGKQNKPAAWVGQDFTTLKTSVYNHTFDVLTALKQVGVNPEWVQVGNETNNGMLWEDGRASASMSNFAQLINSGYSAVKAVQPASKVIVHLSNGYDNTLYRWMFDGLKNNGANWDVIGMSLYPSTSDWQTKNSQILTNINDMISRYGKEVMISEVGMDVNAPASAKAFIADLLKKARSVANNKVLGVFYWEPQAYNNWQGYTLGAFDNSGKPTIAMDAFLEIPEISQTNYVQNGSFDAGAAAVQAVTGWTEGGNAEASFVGGPGNGWNPDGSFYLGHWLGSSYVADTYQTITVPNGIYKLSAYAVGGTGFTERKMYVKDFGGTQQSVAIPGLASWTELSISGIAVTNGQITIGFYSNAGSGTWMDIDKVSLIQTSALPVTLTAFTAKASNSGAELRWTTASEINNSYFTLERSIDNRQFSQIAKINTMSPGNSPTYYSYIDGGISAGVTNYYRLSQVDLDGKKTELGVKALNFLVDQDDFQIYPVPATNRISVAHHALANQAYLLAITDFAGRVVLSENGTSQDGTVVINVTKLSAGTYVLNISTGLFSASKKMLIQ